MKLHGRYLLVASTLLLGTSALASEPDWTAYTQLLARHVSDGQQDGIALKRVDYSALKSDPAWPQTLAALEQFPVQKLETRAETLAFYINAYNILAIRMVLDHWPVTSIKDAGSWISPVWKKPAGTLNGKTVTLQQVEDDFLRSLQEPRIHMAIVCASVSCPDLRAEPYRAATLEQQLDDQATRFLANAGKGLKISGGHAEVSKIFDWFEDDFKVSGGVESFIRRYYPSPQPVVIKDYIDYNWNLNGT